MTLENLNLVPISNFTYHEIQSVLSFSFNKLYCIICVLTTNYLKCMYMPRHVPYLAWTLNLIRNDVYKCKYYKIVHYANCLYNISLKSYFLLRNFIFFWKKGCHFIEMLLSKHTVKTSSTLLKMQLLQPELIHKVNLIKLWMFQQ